MSKPSWDDAPEWAMYLTQDPGGDWHWYQNKPIFKEGNWYPVGGFVQFAGDGHYEMIPEERP